MSRFGSTLLAVMFVFVALFALGTCVPQGPREGPGGDCLSMLRGLRLRALLGLVVACLVVLGLCSPGRAQEGGNVLLLAGPTEGPIYTRFNTPFTAELRQGRMSTPSSGYQAFVSYDPSMIRLVSASYTDFPYGNAITNPIVDDRGKIDTARGILPGQQSLSLDAAVLARLEFEPVGVEGTTSLEFRSHSPPTSFFDAQGQPVPADTLQSLTITVDNTPPSITCPANVSALTDAGRAYATLDIGSATATDSLSGIASVTGVRSDNAALTDGYPIGTTTIIWTATDRAGNTATCTQTVSVVDARPIVVLREDDVRSTCRDPFPEFGNASLLQYGKQLQIPITWGVITDNASKGGSYGLTWAELVDYVTTAGGELASHSKSHKAMDSVDAYISDVLDSKAAIESNTPFPCRTFLQPGTWTDYAFCDSFSKLTNPLWLAVQARFSQSLSYVSQYPFMGAPALRHGIQANCVIDYDAKPVSADFLQALDNVSRTPGKIYIIQFHGIQPSTGTLDYHVRADFMAGVLSKLAELRAAGSIRIAGIDEAFNANQVPPSVNRVYDPGFEFFNPALSKYLAQWSFSGAAGVVDGIGLNDSRACRLAAAGKAEQIFLLPSGRYKLSWSQKMDGSTMLGRAVTPWIQALHVNGTSPVVLNKPRLTNTSNDAWEAKSVVVRIPESANRCYLRFYSEDTYLIDDVQLRLTPADPVTGVSGFKVTPTPAGVQMSWRAPDDGSFTKIQIRYSEYPESPQTPDEGTLLAQVTTQNGTYQSVSCPFNWKWKGAVYFSAFAVREDGTFSEPDVDFIQADQTKPVIGRLSAVGSYRLISATWTAMAANSGIYISRYAVGTAPSGADLVGWTACSLGQATVGPLDVDSCYLSVQTQNVFGVWSDIVSTYVALGAAAVTAAPDGTTVSVTGVVSAIFRDCYYLQFLNRVRGIKVVGPSNDLSLGMTATVQGVLATAVGERYIAVQSAATQAGTDGPASTRR